jgi:hypothetical protein
MAFGAKDMDMIVGVKAWIFLGSVLLFFGAIMLLLIAKTQTKTQDLGIWIALASASFFFWSMKASE